MIDRLANMVLVVGKAMCHRELVINTLVLLGFSKYSSVVCWRLLLFAYMEETISICIILKGQYIVGRHEQLEGSGLESLLTWSRAVASALDRPGMMSQMRAISSSDGACVLADILETGKNACGEGEKKRKIQAGLLVYLAIVRNVADQGLEEGR